MTALRISRAALLLSALLWAAMLAGGYLKVVPAGLALGVGGYAGIAIGVSAAACVVFQFVIRRKAN